ncbi:helix-turn-helix domain-containing protein [Candidatus Poribacteria bacterium]|nr:helix-turn-helix domain-containing protein [Candidatus Poribacteria bacterium]
MSPDRRQEVRDRLDGGETVSAIARSVKTSRQTIMRARDQS